ncbi:hypothetical protein F183_A46690 [Bryobacterales bacterium F-183]|nr:hypothetical protein F183_A46690 [Bryobacterales bacterium F-183]
MMHRNRKLGVVIFGLATAAMALANSAGAPARLSGAPGEGTCAGCHGSTAVNSGGGSLTISLPGGASTYTPGQTYRVRVTLADPTAARWGFSMTVKKESSTDFVGSFAVPAEPATRLVQLNGSNQYATHSPNGTFRQQTTQAAWEVDWTAPAAGTGAVRFYAAGNAANNSASADGADKVYTGSLSLGEASSGPVNITAGNTVIPQFVFGGGWTSSLYFTNNTDAQVAFPVRFFNDSAAEMPFGGSATKQLQIPAKGTALIQAQNTGSLTQGWGTFDLPTGVTGYGVFRQAADGRPDQEAVVPFAASSGTRASLTYDESNLVTGVALWYNGSQAATVTITARDEAGAQIGTGTITMQPGTKTAFALSDRVGAVAGKRGLVEFTSSGGNIAVLGLRFANAAFTSIPAAP